MPHNKKRPAIFLDRDGTINVEKNYLHKIDDFEFLPGAPEAIKRLKDAGYLVVVVTNQSGIGRGFFDEGAVDRLHNHIQQKLAAIGTSIDAFYYCPHHPEEAVGQYRKDCDCRKGQPGMLLQAAREYDIDLDTSFMVGDKIADIEAGAGAGCQSILVTTGYGLAESEKMLYDCAAVCGDLAAAAAMILKDEL